MGLVGLCHTQTVMATAAVATARTCCRSCDWKMMALQMVCKAQCRNSTPELRSPCDRSHCTKHAATTCATKPRQHRRLFNGNCSDTMTCTHGDVSCSCTCIRVTNYVRWRRFLFVALNSSGVYCVMCVDSCCVHTVHNETV